MNLVRSHRLPPTLLNMYRGNSSTLLSLSLAVNCISQSVPDNSDPSTVIGVKSMSEVPCSFEPLLASSRVPVQILRYRFSTPTPRSTSSKTCTLAQECYRNISFQLGPSVRTDPPRLPRFSSPSLPPQYL